MKYLTIASLSLLSLAVLSSCSKDDDKTLISIQTTPKVISSSIHDIVAQESNLTQTALSLNWEPAVYTSDAVIVAYQLHFTCTPTTGGDSTNYYVNLGVLKTPKDMTKSYTIGELNQLLTETMGLSAGIKYHIDLILESYPYTGNSPKPTQSSLIAGSSLGSFDFTPLAQQTKSPDYFFIGAMFGASNSWDNSYTGYPLYLDTPDSKTYTYTGKLEGGAEFKFIGEDNIGTWSGLLGAGTSTTTLSTSGGNISTPSTTGYYTVSLSPKELTYSITSYNASNATSYMQISLIGSAVIDWNTDLDLTASSYDSHIWSKQGIQIKEGELKIRANHDWSESWGGADKPFPAAMAGGDGNIKVSSKQAGTYDVYFNDLTHHFLFRKR